MIMKELSIEEKAKAYDNLIERLKDFQFEYRFSAFSDTIERYFPELKESEDEDERIRKDIVEAVEFHKDFSQKRKEYIYAWLEKQGEQPKKHDICDNCEQQGSCVSPCPMKLVEKHGEQNPVWSEEDEKKFSDILAILRGGENCYYNSPTLIDWLKSLKDRYTWKPTEEQMDALDYYANSLCTYCDRQDDLRSLFNVLNKLKG